MSRAYALPVSKALAGREKDIEFVRAAIRHGLAAQRTLFERLGSTDVDDARRDRAEELFRTALPVP